MNEATNVTPIRRCTVEAAVALAVDGFFVLPLKPGTKIPAIKDFPALAARDVSQIYRWAEQFPGCNWGISTDRYGDDGKALLAVDIDVADGKAGNQTILEHELAGRELPPTRSQTSPTGSKHYLYLVDETVKSGAGTLGKNVDSRSYHGYVVGAGSVTEDGRYTIDDTPLAEAPRWAIDMCGPPNVRKAPEQAPPPENLDGDRAASRGRYHLENECPTATTGERNPEGYKAAAQLREFGVDKATCLYLMKTSWKCEPMLDDWEVEHVVNSAFSYSQRPQGAAAPEAQFQPIETPINDEAPAAPDRKRFAITSGRDLLLDYAKRRDLIEDVLPEHGLSMIVGAPKSRKSFLALDMALHVALGRDWHGQRVKAGAVAYIAAEAPESIRMRLDAWCRRHDTDMGAIPFGVISDAPNLRTHDDTADLIAAVREFDNAPALIVVDTLNQAFGGGDENSASDAGVFVRRCQELHRHTGAHVLVIHHLGKDEKKGSRGSTAFVAGVDNLISVTKRPDVSIAYRSEVKDGQEGAVLTFGLESVALGENYYGKPVQGAVLRPTRPAATDVFTPQRQPKGEKAQRALAKLQEIVASKNDDDPSPWADEEAWRKACVGELSPGASLDTDARAFRRVRKELLQEKFIAARDGKIRLENFLEDYGDDEE